MKHRNDRKSVLENKKVFGAPRRGEKSQNRNGIPSKQLKNRKFHRVYEREIDREKSVIYRVKSATQLSRHLEVFWSYRVKSAGRLNPVMPVVPDRETRFSLSRVQF